MKIRSKHSCVLPLCLLRFFLKQTLVCLSFLWWQAFWGNTKKYFTHILGLGRWPPQGNKIKTVSFKRIWITTCPVRFSNLLTALSDGKVLSHHLWTGFDEWRSLAFSKVPSWINVWFTLILMSKNELYFWGTNHKFSIWAVLHLLVLSVVDSWQLCPKIRQGILNFCDYPRTKSCIRQGLSVSLWAQHLVWYSL